jgi:fumarate reductase flavoprotein subunit
MARGPWHEEADLIVVGGSIGGLAAAVLVADRGGRAIVIERMKELGGGAAAEAEAIPAPGSRFQRAAGIEDAPERFAAELVTAAGGQLDHELAAALAAQGAPLVAWLADRCSVAIQLVAEHAGTGHGVPRLHAPGERGGAGLVVDLGRAASRHSHVSVRAGAAAEHLLRDDAGAVRGVSVRGDRRGAAQAIGGNVLLAAGGFVADDALVAEHAASLAELPYQGSAKATGEGLRLGREAGAATRHLSAGLVTPFLAMPGALAVTAPLVDLGAILVNQAGARFVDEAGPSLSVARAVRGQPGHIAYLVFDERIAAAGRATDPFFSHVVLPRAGRRGASVQELAKQFELRAEGLSACLDSLGQGPDALGRRTLGPLTPPLHAIRVTGARLQTLGGLAVDAAARVLDAEGRPVPGLYAAGGSAVGLAGDGTGTALAGREALRALGLGRLAALDVVAARAASDAD